jgi:transposase
MLGKRGERQREFVFEEPAAPETNAKRLLREIDVLVDWSVVRRLSAGFFSSTGRPSIDPVVMVKMMLVGYLFGVPSDRQLVEECADRLSFREFLGYGLSESLPAHSSFTHWRKRLGSEFFRSLLHDVVRQCVEYGMPLSTARTVDGTSVKAQADGNGPLLEVPAGQDPDAFVASFFAGEMRPSLAKEPATTEPAPGEEVPAGPGDEVEESTDGAGDSGEQPKPKRKPKRPKPTPISLNDPDARMHRKRGEVAAFRYHASFCADAATGLVMDATATALECAETAVEHARRDPFAVTELVADALYDDGESLAALQWLGVTTYVPDRKRNGTRHLEATAFAYDEGANEYMCPQGHRLCWFRFDPKKRLDFYVAHMSDCGACPRKAECTAAKRRTVTRTLHAEGLDRCVRKGPRYRALMRSRRINEHLNRMAKRDHALTRARGLGVEAMRTQAALTAIAIDLKKLVAQARAAREGVALPRTRQHLAAVAKGLVRAAHALQSALGRLLDACTAPQRLPHPSSALARPSSPSGCH